MKKIIIGFLLTAFLTILAVPPEAMADSGGDPDWGAALIAAGIISVAILIVWVVTKESSKSAEDLNKEWKIAEDSYFTSGIRTDKFSHYPNDDHEKTVLFYSFKVMEF
ncbi:MAG: hypothetical protein AB1390_12705 [Nitrospirota bacterium]